MGQHRYKVATIYAIQTSLSLSNFTRYKCKKIFKKRKKAEEKEKKKAEKEANS